MRYLAFILCLVSINLNSQVFWTETFNNGCSSNCVANGVNTGNGAWSVVSLAGDANPTFDYPNQWYISCAENGHTTTVCGTGCTASSAANTLASLHMGSTSAGDIGAAFDAGGLCGFFYCTNTHKRVQSPNISTVGKTNITLTFDYIEFGQGTSDDMYAVQTSTNGGTSWVTLTNPAKTTCCGGTCNGSLQGRWTAYTSAVLPVSCENITNFRIAFVWINNDDGVGTDPSFAVDNIKLSTPVPVPIELISFSYSTNNGSTILSWQTLSEKNSDHFEVLRSDDGFSFNTIGSIKTSGHENQLKKYSFPDQSSDKVVYYKLRMVDKDGSYDYSPMLAVDAYNSLASKNNIFLNSDKDLEIAMDYVLVNSFVSLALYDVSGKTIGNYELRDHPGESSIRIPKPELAPGIYLVQLKGEGMVKSHKIYIP
jgi:hypothetical protein